MTRRLEFHPIKGGNNMDVWGCNYLNTMFLLSHMPNSVEGRPWVSSIRLALWEPVQVLGAYPTRREAMETLEDRARLLWKGLRQ